MSSWTSYSQNKTIPREQLAEKVTQIRREGKTIATLNGSFDLLHAGHLYMLYEASKTADVLIVALNTDDSIRSYKGNERPIIPLSHRMEMLSALAFVDYVTSFDEPDPRILLELISPDVHVNGVEYGKTCIEALTVEKNGGRLHLVERLRGLATTDLIKKIQRLGTQCD